MGSSEEFHSHKQFRQPSAHVDASIRGAHQCVFAQRDSGDDPRIHAAAATDVSAAAEEQINDIELEASSDIDSREIWRNGADDAALM